MHMNLPAILCPLPAAGSFRVETATERIGTIVVMNSTAKIVETTSRCLLMTFSKHWGGIQAGRPSLGDPRRRLRYLGQHQHSAAIRHQGNSGT